MCTADGKSKDKTSHTKEDCCFFNHIKFKGTTDTLVPLSDEQRREKRLKKQSLNKNNKSNNNYSTAYNAQQELPEVKAPQEGQEEINFLIDSGANINIVRDANLFVSTSSTKTRLKSLGKTHNVDLGGIVDAYENTGK